MPGGGGGGGGHCHWRLYQMRENRPQKSIQGFNGMPNRGGAGIWANLGNPIESYDFSKFWLISCMPPSQAALC